MNCASVMGLPGKPNGISGADVERYYAEGRIHEIAEYCESDVLNTFRVWLRYELFRGGLSYDGFRRSEDNLMQFIAMRGNTKWPAPGFKDTELGVSMEPEVGHGETEVYPRV